MQAYEIELRRVNRALQFVDGPAFAQLDEFQLRERIRRFEEAFAAADRHHRILIAEAPDEQERRQMMDRFDELGERVNDALASYRRRAAEVAPAAALPAPPPANNNDGANAGNNAGQPNGPDNANVIQNAVPQPPLVQPAAPGVQQVPLAAGQQGMNIHVSVPFQPHQIQKTWGKFDGNPLTWFDFKQRFQLAVHNVNEVPRANKMAYLRDALTGEAAEAMKGYGIDPERYDEFWNALVNKYEQRYTLACAYLSRFFGLPRLHRGSAAAELRRMSNDTNGLLRQMRELGYEADRWNLIIVHALQERLSPELKRKWLTVRNGNDDPPVVLMTQFIDDEADALANRAVAYQPPPPPPQAQAYGAVGGAIPKVQMYACGVCGSMTHLPPDCPEFRPLIFQDRLKVATSSRICFNCLKRGHGKATCFDPHRCREPACQPDNAHNSLLCPVKNKPEYVQTVRHETAAGEYAPVRERALNAPPAMIDGSSSIPNFSRKRSTTSAGRGRGTMVRQPFGSQHQDD